MTLAFVLGLMLSNTSLAHLFGILPAHGQWAKWTLPVKLNLFFLDADKIKIAGFSSRWRRRKCNTSAMLGKVVSKVLSHKFERTDRSFVRAKGTLHRKSRPLPPTFRSPVNALGLRLCTTSRQILTSLAHRPGKLAFAGSPSGLLMLMNTGHNLTVLAWLG